MNALSLSLFFYRIYKCIYKYTHASVIYSQMQETGHAVTQRSYIYDRSRARASQQLARAVNRLSTLYV